MINIIDTIKLDKIGIREKLEKEVDRYQKFKTAVLGISEQQTEQAKETDLRNYAKYILKEGTIFEKREFLSCLRSKLTLKDKKLVLEA